MNLNGKTAWVVGGTRGIGRAVAVRLARLGARVGLTGRDETRARVVAHEVSRDAGAEVLGYGLDVVERARIPEVFARLCEDLGEPDILVYNAGISPVFTSAEKIPLETWDRVLAVNLTGAFVAAQVFARPLIEAGRPGAIVFIGSVLSLVGGQRLAAYTASKSGLLGVARALAVDWAPHRIRVNLVAPGWVVTDLTAGIREHEGLRRFIEERTPLGRMANPEEIAEVVAFLVAEEAGFVTGAAYAIDGGWTAW